MSLQRLFFPNKPFLFKKKIKDDIFGLMLFNKNSKLSYYQGHFLFKPSNKEIDIFLDSNKAGINPKQKIFFHQIENNYNQLVIKISQAITEKLNKRKLREIIINDFSNEFTLYAISISWVSQLNQEWSLSYHSDIHSPSGLTVNFKNWEIININ